MLIWDKEKKEHIIRINGLEKERVKATDFNLATTEVEDETAIKSKVNNKLDKHHTHIHIFDKSTSLTPTKKLNYVIWIGPIETEPIIPPDCKYWWEKPDKEVFNGKNI